MLLDNQPEKIMLGYQFHFGLSVKPDVIFQSFCSDCPFHQISFGCYHICDDRITECPLIEPDKTKNATSRSTSEYLKMYQKNVRRRLRPQFRRLRDALVMEIKPISIAKYSIDGGKSFRSCVDSNLHILINLQKISVGCITFWFENIFPTDEASWQAFRDPNMLIIEITSQHFTSRNWAITDLVRYFILLCFLGLNNQYKKDIDYEKLKCLRSDIELDKYLRKNLSELYDFYTPIIVDMENYPFFFIKYNLTTQELQKKFRENPSDLRITLCGDKNWIVKSKKFIEATIFRADTSTRDSIIWLVNSEGTVKLFSSEIETSLEESLTATFLETDIILTMRYLLHKINDLLLNLSLKTLLPSELAQIRHLLFSEIDKYCNIEVSHKDTTRRRIEQLKSIFRLDTTYNGVKDRFKIVTDKMETYHNVTIVNQQTLITLIFGFFGSLAVFYTIFSQHFSEILTIGVGLFSSSITTIILLLIIRSFFQKYKPGSV